MNKIIFPLRSIKDPLSPISGGFLQTSKEQTNPFFFPPGRARRGSFQAELCALSFAIIDDPPKEVFFLWPGAVDTVLPPTLVRTSFALLHSACPWMVEP